MQNLQTNYTIRDMARMFRRVDELTRANNSLTKQLATAEKELAQAQTEISDLTAQLDDMQGDFVRQMTAPRALTMDA